MLPCCQSFFSTIILSGDFCMIKTVVNIKLGPSKSELNNVYNLLKFLFYFCLSIYKFIFL